MREEEMVAHLHRRFEVAHPRRVNANPMAGVRDDLGLVQGHPVTDAVAEPPRDDVRVASERGHRLRRRPATTLLERLWQIPVVQSDEGPNTVLEQLVDEPVVEREPRLIHGAAPARYDAGPADREAIGVAAQVAQESDVLAVAVVVIAGDVAGLAGRDRARLAAERVPNRRPLPVRVMGSLDLVGGRRRAEEEALRKAPREGGRVAAAHRPGSASGHSMPMRALIPPST